MRDPLHTVTLKFATRAMEFDIPTLERELKGALVRSVQDPHEVEIDTKTDLDFTPEPKESAGIFKRV